MHALLIAAALLLANPAKPPSPEEQRLYEEGARALATGDAPAAERAFKAGYALRRDPAFLVHLGEAQEKAGAAGQAAETYRRYLREAPDASDRADIEARLARLAPAGSATPATPPSVAPEPTGEFGASPPAAPPAASPAPTTAPSVDTERPAAREASDDSGWNRYNTTAVIASGAALLLLGSAAFFGATAASNKDEVNRFVLYQDERTGAPLPYSAIAGKYEEAFDDGRRNDRLAKAALIAAGGAAAIAAVFYVLDAKLGQEPTIAVAPDARGVAVVGGWRWRY